MANKAIEDIVVSYIIQNKDMGMLERNGLTHEEFSGNAREVLKYVEDHYQEYGNVPDEATVIYELGDKYSNVVITESPLYIEEALLSHVGYNSLYKAIVDNQGKLQGSPKDIREAIEDIAKKAEEGVSKGVARSLGTDLTKDRGRIDEYSQRIMGEGEEAVMLNIPSLDESLGGVLADDLIVVYARPSVGKSYMMTYMASQLHKQGLNVLFYSGEMDENQVGYRFDSMRAHVSNSALLSGRSFPKGSASYEAYQKYLEELEQQDNYFRVVTPGRDFNGQMPTVKDIELLNDELQPDVIFIDQISLMRDHERAREKRDQFTNIMRDLRNLAGIKRVPIFVASQANRQAAVKDEEGEFEIPEVHHLAESDAVGQYATRVIGMSSKQTADNRVKILKLGVKKNRHGHEAEFEMTVNFDLGYVEENVPSDTDNLEISEREVPF